MLVPNPVNCMICSKKLDTDEWFYCKKCKETFYPPKSKTCKICPDCGLDYSDDLDECPQCKNKKNKP